VHNSQNIAAPALLLARAATVVVQFELSELYYWLVNLINFIINEIKFIKSKMQIIAYITLNLNVICFSFCNNMQILISVVFLNYIGLGPCN